MIKQTNPALPEDVNDFGCYFCSCLFIAEKRTGKTMDVDRVMAIYRAAKATGIIGEQCYVKDPISLMALAGVNVQSVVKANNSRVPSSTGFELLHFHRDADTPKGMNNSVHDHFVAGDGSGKVAFDPIENSNTVKYGFLENKRIFA